MEWSEDGRRAWRARASGAGGGIVEGAGDVNAEANAHGGGGFAELPLADHIEEPGAIAEGDGRGGDGIPQDVAEAADAGKVAGDLIPVIALGDVARGAEMLQARGVEGDGALIKRIYGYRLAGGEGLRQVDDGFAGERGVVEVGVEGLDFVREALRR